MWTFLSTEKLEGYENLRRQQPSATLQALYSERGGPTALGFGDARPT